MDHGASSITFGAALADYAEFVKLQNGDVYFWGQGCRDPMVKTDNPRLACVGILERDANLEVVRYDIKAQCAQVLRNLERLYFNAGVKPEQIREAYVFVTNHQDGLEIGRTVEEFFTGVPQQKLRFQIVGSLPLDNKVEIKSIGTTNPSGEIAEIEPIYFNVSAELAESKFEEQAASLYQQLDSELARRSLTKANFVDGTLIVRSGNDYGRSNEVWNKWISDCRDKPARTTVFVPNEDDAIQLRAIISDLPRT